MTDVVFTMMLRSHALFLALRREEGNETRRRRTRKRKSAKQQQPVSIAFLRAVRCFRVTKMSLSSLPLMFSYNHALARTLIDATTQTTLILQRMNIFLRPLAESLFNHTSDWGCSYSDFNPCRETSPNRENYERSFALPIFQSKKLSQTYKSYGFTGI